MNHSTQYHGQIIQEGFGIGRIWSVHQGYQPDSPIILVANEICLQDLMMFSDASLQGMIIHQNTRCDHVSVLAQSLNIPYITGIDVQDHWYGMLAVLDGYQGDVLLSPSKEELAHAKQKQQNYHHAFTELKASVKVPSYMANGEQVQFLATLHDLSKISRAIGNSAEGIGLFRSEFIFLQSDSIPDEDIQYWTYRTLMQCMEGRPATIRTLDIGSDKTLKCMPLPAEENPALGERGIRFCLNRPDWFKQQLRALLRAAPYGSLRISYPMITSLDEFLQCKALIEACKLELTQEGIPYGEVAQGVMIETPAAVMISDELCRHSDFVSIGTTDLMQYTLAADRCNPAIAHLLDPMHPAMFAMIRMVVEAANRNQTDLTLCGNIAYNLTMLPHMLSLGVRSFSLPSDKIPLFRSFVSSN